MKIIMSVTFLFLVGLMVLPVEAKAGHRAGHHRASFEELDANKDGKITLKELKAKHEKRIAEKFKKMDKNGNGSVTRAEYEKPKFRNRTLFQTMDANKDGKVDEKEFNKGMKKHKKETKNQKTCPYSR